MRRNAASNGRTRRELCGGILWILRLGYLALLALFAQSLFPPRAGWAGLLTVGMALAALLQLPVSCIRGTLRAGALPRRARQESSAGGGALEGALEWRDVAFRFPGEDKLALRQVSFRLTAGFTAVFGDERELFGPLSVGRLRAAEGTVYYGTTPIEGISVGELACKVALLSGRDAPEAETVAELLQAEDEKGRDLARELGLHPLIQAAGGYQAPPERLSEGGLVLARVAAALAGKPRLLILERILERLDEVAADRVLETAARHGTDCVAVGTRECLPRRHGRILQFQGDTLLFQGTRDEFLAWEEAGHGRDTP